MREGFDPEGRSLLVRGITWGMGSDGRRRGDELPHLRPPSGVSETGDDS